MKKTIISMLMACPIAVMAETVIVEAESFADFGGWVNDTQFIDQMGSPYLLAHGLGKKVADAKTVFSVKGGRYRVFVRTMNWTGRWCDEAAGLFQVLVNGKALTGGGRSEFGSGSPEWSWRDAGEIELACGAQNLALHDLTGFDGRCDAIAFTAENLSAGDIDAVRRKRAGEKCKTLPKFDFCVVGGGIAGISAAVSAARLGLSVALIQNRPVLGGNNSSEVRVHLGAYQNLPPFPRLGDVLAEYGPRKGGNAQPAANYEDDRKLAVVKAEKNISLFLNEHVNAVKVDNSGRVLSVTAVNTRTGAKTEFPADYFADCTGDANLGFLAGARFRMGREAKSETGEDDAPEKADMMTMGSSVQWYAGDAEDEAVFPVRPWMLKTINEGNCSAHLKGDWWWETGLGRDQIREGEYIRDYGLLVAFSNWAFVKNSAGHGRKFAGKELKWVAYNAGRRETRGLTGDFVLTQTHLRRKEFQRDGTCTTTWTIDLHLPKTVEQSKFEGEPYQTNSFNEKIWPYPIPYRCFYSCNVPNLFMAGRNISVTHIALGTTRLMRTHGMMGEVVGMAAAVCKKNDCLPRDVYTTYFGDLKELMLRGVGDGKKHPRQVYNCQASLDREIRRKHEESVKGLVE